MAQQLRDCELRLEAAMRENVGLKGELDRLAHQASPHPSRIKLLCANPRAVLVCVTAACYFDFWASADAWRRRSWRWAAL